MVTDMTITGRPAQFGRGVISDVADKIIGQFAGCVAQKLASGGAEPRPPRPAAAAGRDTRRDRGRGRAAAATAPPSAGSTATAPRRPGRRCPIRPRRPRRRPRPATPAPRSTGPVRSEIDAIDLLDTAGSPVLKRLAPVAGGGLLLVLVILLIRRLRG